MFMYMLGILNLLILAYPECRELNEVENGMMECHFGTLPPSVKEVCRFRCDPGTYQKLMVNTLRTYT